MSINLIGFLATCFAGMTWLNRIAEGAMLKAEEVSILNTLTLTHDETLFGTFSIPVLNLDFFFVGIPRLVKWDYAFFGSNAAIFQYFLYAFTFAVSFGLFMLLIGMVSQFFARR